jgi:hypothetical protein
MDIEPSTSSNQAAIHWTIVYVCEQLGRGPGGLRHAAGIDTSFILHKVGCDHIRMKGSGCAEAQVVPPKLIERARRRKGFARVVRRGRRWFIIFIDWEKE